MPQCKCYTVNDLDCLGNEVEVKPASARIVILQTGQEVRTEVLVVSSAKTYKHP